jgi:hypothetical protein
MTEAEKLGSGEENSYLLLGIGYWFEGKGLQLILALINYKL